PFPKRVPSSVVRCLSLIEKARPSNRYCTARALATWRARKSTVKARPAAKSSVHSSFSKAKKGRRSPESAHFNAASKACWPSRRFSSRFVIGARVPFGWFLISQPNICRRDARPFFTAQLLADRQVGDPGRWRQGGRSRARGAGARSGSAAGDFVALSSPAWHNLAHAGSSRRTSDVRGELFSRNPEASALRRWARLDAGPRFAHTGGP